jgi:hypothetical protein
MLLEGVETAAREVEVRAGRPFAAAGEDLHHRGDRIRAVQRALRSAHDLDPVDAVGREIRKIVRAARLVRLDAIDQDLVEIRVAAADEQIGRASAAPGLHDREARNVAQHLERVGDLRAFDLVAIHHRYRRGDLIETGLDPGRRNHHPIQIFRGVRRLQRCITKRQKDCRASV